MLVTKLLLALQLTGVPAPSTPDSVRTPAPVADVYASPALAELVRRASERNRNAPAALRGYRARVTSEIAVVSRREDGTEAVAAVEQLASAVHWRRPGIFDQEVIGYRAQALGPNVSALTYVDRPWLVPSLYGNRMALFFGRDTSARGERRRRRAEERRERRNRPPLLAVHPLAEDREAVYRFAGGDTVATVHVNGRAIPIVRVLVEPREDARGRRLVFRGELDLDGTRHEVVRMRGQFLTYEERLTLRDRLQRLVAEPLAFVELENQELEGRYWLPARQRLELQAVLPIAGDARGILRVQSTFRDMALDLDRTLAALPDDSAAHLTSEAGDTLQSAPFTLRLAPRDSLEAYRDWPRPIGEATAELRADDFDDVAPDRYRTTGPPRLEPAVPRASDAVHFNRVEGLYTGAGVRWRLRDAVPGLELHATGGWAWSERTARGRAGAALDRGVWRLTTTAGRRLDLTNDFRVAFDSGSSVAAALFSSDDYDYVDRRFADLRLARRLPGPVRAELGVELGVFEDAAVAASLTRGLLRGDSGFRANRGVDEGRYRRGAFTLRVNPGWAGDFLSPGAGVELRWERGRGDLRYDRLEAMLAARHNRGPWTVAARADGGVLLGDEPPPQQLFELGGTARLPGYDYKAFAGDEAALLAGMLMWASPLWRAPLVVRAPFVRRLVLPAPNPAVAVTVQGGWTRLTTEGARAAAWRLGTRAGPDGAPLPIARATDGMRTTVELQLRFFGGAIGVGVARAVDRRDGWSVGLASGTAW